MKTENGLDLSKEIGDSSGKIGMNTRIYEGDLGRNLESQDIEARYKSQMLRLKSKFDIPDDLSGKLIKILPNDEELVKDDLFPRIYFSDNGIYAAAGSSIYLIRDLGNHWENVTLPRSKTKDRTGGFGVEMFVGKVCKNAEKYKVEIEDKKDDGRLG